MQRPENVGVLRDLRGGRPPQFDSIKVQAGALAGSVSAFLLEHPEAGERTAALQSLLEAAQRVVDQPAPKLLGNPLTLLTAAQFGRALNGLGDDMVRLREKDGSIFSVMPLGRKRGRLYPAFQAWEGIAGSRLAQVLSCLRGLDGDSQLQFFAEQRSDLENLTPVEMLSGKALDGRQISDEAEAALDRGVGTRLGQVMQAARAFFQKNT